MRSLIIIWLFFSVSIVQTAKAQEVNDAGYRDIYPDTWAGTDALGRIMPNIAEVGQLKTDQHQLFFTNKNAIVP